MTTSGVPNGTTTNGLTPGGATTAQGQNNIHTSIQQTGPVKTGVMPTGVTQGLTKNDQNKQQ